jgi:hypothetical protein
MECCKTKWFHVHSSPSRFPKLPTPIEGGKMKFRLASLLVCLVSICFAQKDPRLKGSFREDKNGWIQIHLEGAPSEIGFQHGYLLSDEITDAVHMMGYFLKGSTQREWNFYRQAAERMFWPKLDP